MLPDGDSRSINPGAAFVCREVVEFAGLLSLDNEQPLRIAIQIIEMAKLLDFMLMTYITSPRSDALASNLT